MAGRRARSRHQVQQQGWSALTNAQRDDSFLQRPLLPSFTRELPAPDPHQFAPLKSFHPQLPSPATIPSFAGVVKQQYEAILHPPSPHRSSSLPSAFGSCYGECNHGSDAIAPLDSRALAISRLQARHSWADVALISDILQAFDFDEDSTSACLHSMVDDNMNRVSASYSAERPLQTQSIDDGELSYAKEETSLHSSAGQGDFRLDAEGGDFLSLSNPAPIEPEWKVDDIYLSTRKDALRLSRASGKHARGAYNAFMVGDHDKAKLLSKQAKEERAEADRMHAVAAKQILQARNAETLRDLWHLDLHGLHVNEAVDALKRRLQEIENPNHAQHVSPPQSVPEEMKLLYGPVLLGLPVVQELKVITGVGKHSRDGGSLPTAIQSFLIENRYKFDNSKPGVVAVRPKFRG